MRQPRNNLRRGKQFAGRLRFDMAYRHRWNRFRLEHLVASPQPFWTAEMNQGPQPSRYRFCCGFFGKAIVRIGLAPGCPRTYAVHLREPSCTTVQSEKRPFSFGDRSRSCRKRSYEPRRHDLLSCASCLEPRAHHLGDDGREGIFAGHRVWQRAFKNPPDLRVSGGPSRIRVSAPMSRGALNRVPEHPHERSYEPISRHCLWRGFRKHGHLASFEDNAGY